MDTEPRGGEYLIMPNVDLSISVTETPIPTETPLPTETGIPTETATPDPTPTVSATPVPQNGQARYTNDGDGSMVKSVIGEVTTYYVNAGYEKKVKGNDQVERKYYTAGGTRIAMRENGNLTWLLSDHLGSTSVTADASGTLLNTIKYTAFGEIRSGASGTDYQYTGQRNETEVGLYYYVARFYDPNLLQFNQPDSIIPDLYNSLDWNRYAYTKYNPINGTDPTGHMVSDPRDAGWWDKVTPVFILEHIIDTVPQEKMLVAYMYNHPEYNSQTDNEIIEAGYDPAAMSAFLAIEQFKAEVIRSEYETQSLTEFWATYAAPAVAAGIVLGGIDDQPIGDINWKFRDTRHERVAYEKRGWSEETINDVLTNPVDTATTIDLQTNQSCTVYYRSDGHYVVRNNVTGELIHVSNTNDLGWIDPFTNKPVSPR